MNEKHIKEVFKDEAFTRGLFELETPDEVQAALREKDIDMTIEEIVQLKDMLVKAFEIIGEDGELSLDQLDEVAGGVGFYAVLVGCFVATAPVIAGMPIVALAVSFVGYLITRRW